MRDHYQVLGVAPGATTEEIRRAYIAAARRAHPDFHDDGDQAGRAAAEERMREINRAWEELSDPARRARYDRDRGLGARPAPAPAADPSTVGTRWQPFDPGPDPGFDLRHDRPITSGGIPAWLRTAPVLLFGGGVAAVVAGGLLGLRSVVGVGLLAVSTSFVLFVAAALVALTSSKRESPPRETR